MIFLIIMFVSGLLLKCYLGIIMSMKKNDKGRVREKFRD